MRNHSFPSRPAALAAALLLAVAAGLQGATYPEAQAGSNANTQLLFYTYDATGFNYLGSVLWLLDGQGGFVAAGTPSIPAAAGLPLVKGQASGNTTLAFSFPDGQSVGTWTYNANGTLIAAATYGPFANTITGNVAFSPSGQLVVIWSSSVPGGELYSAWTLDEYGNVVSAVGPYGPYANTSLEQVVLKIDGGQQWFWSSPSADESRALTAVWSFDAGGHLTGVAQYGPF